MIDEKKLIEDILHNDRMNFTVKLDPSTAEGVGVFVREYTAKMKEGFIDLINAQPKVNGFGGWIHVSDRLPDLIPCSAGTAYSEAVIVWTSGKKAMIAVWDGIDFLWAADYWEAWGENITHWMPLPEPPKDVET